METIQLDGRSFLPVNESISAAQDDFIMLQLRRAGVNETLDLLPENATFEQRSKAGAEMYNRILESGRKYKLLGGLLTEEGKPWTEEEALRNAAIFSGLHTIDERVLMHRVVIRQVSGFLRFGEASSPTSPNSSNQNGEGHATENAEAAISAISAE